MAKLQRKIKVALDEGRMLILGAQVLIGLNYRSVFEKSFEELSKTAQNLKLASLAIMLLCAALLMAPGAYHRIVRNGEDTPDVHSFTTTVMDWALLPFVIGFGIDVGIAKRNIHSDWVRHLRRTGCRNYGILFLVRTGMAAGKAKRRKDGESESSSNGLRNQIGR